MNNEFLKYAYAALLHDIGKFYQRTEATSHLTEEEKVYMPYAKNGNYQTHVHSGYTYKFFEKYLKSRSDVERASSSHHIYNGNRIDEVIQKADSIASSVDYNDEIHDDFEEHKKTKYSYITARLNSIMCDIYFGKQGQKAVFPLGTIDKIFHPMPNFIPTSVEESTKEYKDLFQQFTNEVESDGELLGDLVTPYKFNRMYALLYKYTTLIPSSTFETTTPTVSLFDHLKLTTAIASCLYYNNTENFYMCEFDISGIQKFIYHITEGEETKPKLTKSLRGRSAFVSILTNSVTYAILNEFNLTQANIIFNTGGGAAILLPYLEDTESRVSQLCYDIVKKLYEKFNTNLTFVYAVEKLNKKELEQFKIEKALALKTKLDDEKHRKFMSIINDEFSFQSIGNQNICQMCGDNSSKLGKYCEQCEMMIDISDKYTRNDEMSILYDFHRNDKCDIDLGFASITFLDKNDRRLVYEDNYFYIDAVNHFNFGNVKMIANLVPQKMTFEHMVETLGDDYGDKKLGILKMDVDNLGAIFAFGLKQNSDDEISLQRSLSKYLTLSRFIELFFSSRLKQICLDVSRELESKYENIFYINYAGGDDLVIMGPIYGIVMLADRIKKEFKAYVCNPNITLSAGIHVQSPKKPIRFGIQMADDALETSKGYSEDDKIVKNAITIIGKTVSFEDFSNILNKVEIYRQYILQGKISRTGFYNIMSHIQVSSIEQFFALIPKIQYAVVRQVIDEKIRNEYLKEINSIKKMLELDRLILMMKLVILFTREVN